MYAYIFLYGYQDGRHCIIGLEYKLLKGRGIARIVLGSSDEACTVRAPANVPKNSSIMATLLQMSSSFIRSLYKGCAQ